MPLNAKMGVLWIFWQFWAVTSLYHSQGEATELSLCALRHDCNKVLYFIPNSRKSNSNSDRNFCCTISLYCKRNNLLFSTFLMHSIWWNNLHTLQRNLQGSDTRVHTQKNLVVFWVNPPKKPTSKYVRFTFCFANNKTFYSIYCGWSFWTFNLTSLQIFRHSKLLLM